MTDTRLEHPAELASASLAHYVAGFVGALVLTCAAFGIVASGILSPSITIAGIIGLALVQLGVHLVFFLHLARPTHGRWRPYILLTTVGVVLVLVVGSLWIMANLNTRMTPSQQRQYMSGQGGM